MTAATDTGTQSGGGVSSRLPFVVPLLAIGTFLMCTSEYIVAGLLQEIAKDLAVTDSQVGLLITAFAIGMIVGAPVMALATLRLPRRGTLVLALVVFALGQILGAMSDSFVLLLVARVITALATGAFWSVAAVVATTAAGPSRSTRALGVMMSGVALSTVAGLPLGSFAGQLIGWRGAFWSLAILAVVAALIIRFAAPPDGERAHPSIGAELAELRNPLVWVLVVATVLITGAFMGAFSYLSPLVTDRAGLAEWAVPIVLVTYGVGALVGTNLAGRFADRRPMFTFITAAVVGGVVLAVLIPLSVSPLALFVLVLVLGCAGTATPPVVTGLAVRFASGAPTLAAAISVSAFNAGTAFASLLGGFALDSRLGTVGPEALGVVLMVLGLIPLVVLTLPRNGGGFTVRHEETA